MVNKFTFGLLCALLFSLSACSSSFMTSSKSFYNTYIDPPTEFEFDKDFELSQPDQLLATNLMKVGQELTNFKYALSALELPPTSTTVDELLLRFPWIDGITLINDLGTVTGALPATYPSYIDFSTLLSYPEGGNKRATRAVLQKSYDIDTMLVGVPVYDNFGAPVGVFIAYFNLREFIKYMDVSPYVFILAGNTPLWFGEHDINETPLAGVDFIDELTSNSEGTESNKFGKAKWINYYFFDLPLIFSVMQED